MPASSTLASLKVVEYGNSVSAPYCTKILADAGAEVVKIEKPVVGDSARYHGPFPGDLPHREKSGLFLHLNTSKLGITLDLEQATGRHILLQLLRDADLFVENSHPAYLRKLGLDYDSLRRPYPRLIYVSITPYGHKGPYADQRGYDINSAALGGAAEQIGHLGREPLAPPFSQSGLQAGIAGASAALTAFLVREVSGQGQHVDISEAEVWATLQTGMENMTHPVTGVTSMRSPRAAGSGYPPSFLRCKDGNMMVSMPQAAQWNRFLEVIGKPEWVTDPRFKDRRALNPDPLREMQSYIDSWFATRTKQELYDVFRDARVPVTPLSDMADLVNSPQEQARGFFQEVSHPTAGDLKHSTAAYQFGATPLALGPAPTLGEHNELILCQRLGYSPQDMVSLFRAGVI